LPFANSKRQVPREGVLAKIKAYTSGDILPEHFYPPRLRAKPADEDYAPVKNFLDAPVSA
jgi:hypothetical protein